MSKEIALSFSKVSTYDDCPRKFQLQYITKAYPKDDDNPYFVKGKKLHKQLEDYAAFKIAGNDEKVKMSAAARNALGIVNNLLAKYEDCYPEQKLCVGKSWKKLPWFAKNAYWRAIIDFLAMDDDRLEAVVIDYKSGKVRDYSGFGGQLHLTAYLLMKMIPTLQKVSSAYLYLEHKQTVKVVVTRDDLDSLDKYFSDKYQEINSDTMYEPKRNEHCGYCMATSKQCKYKSRKEL